MSDPGKAVFLSYASQDSEAVKRICDALRAAGIEVWFDQDELVGGDAWDTKIRKQIKDCALFMPVISAATEARAEGYFRIEWRLADRRMEAMGKAKTFLLPVCIDDTRDSEADVPDSFTAVQWTRLKSGEPTPAFVARVQKLLSGEVGPVSDRPFGSAAPGEAGQRPALPPKRPAWLIPAAIVVVVAVSAAIWQQRRNSEEAAESSARRSAPTTPGSAVPLSAARQLAAKSARLHDQLENASRSDLELAEQYCQQAVALDPNDGEVWAEYSLVGSNYIAMGLDRSDERLQAVRTQAERAVKLAPGSSTAQLALAISYRWRGATQDEAIRRLRELAERLPYDRLVLRSLGNALRRVGKSEEALSYFARAAALPGGDPLALFQRAMALEALGRNEEAIASLDESLALHPGAAAYILKVFQLTGRGDLEAARAALDKVPAPFLVEERGALAANLVYQRQRQWDQSLNALLAVPRDYFEDAYYTGPKGLLTGNARFHAGRKIAAELDWRAALQLVNQRLGGTKDTTLLHLRKAELHARLGEADEADRAFRTFQELRGGGESFAKLQIDLFLNRTETAIQSLQAMKLSRETLVVLRQDPDWDPLRGDPRFEALLKTEDGGQKAEDRGRRTEDSAPIDQKSVAVLAFANLSDDKANEYFSDGISEELLNVLAKVPGLKVSARTSAFYFKGKEMPIPEIARQLGVAYVIEGSVRKQGSQVRIRAQLVKAADGFPVWSDTFTRDLKDIFAVQDEIAGLVAQQLQLKLGGAARAAAPIKPEAFELYVQARRAWNLRTAAGFAEAEELLTRALLLEPDSARAHVALADVWMLRALANGVIDTFGQRQAPVFAQIVSGIEKALALDPDSSEARASLGLSVRLRQWDLPAAEREFRRAVELNPNYATAHHWLGNCLFESGRIDEGLAELRRAAELDPFSLRILQAYAKGLVRAGRHQEALAVLGRAEVLQARAPQTLFIKAEALLQLGRRAEALALTRELDEAERAELLAKAGDKTEAEAALGEAEGWFRYQLLNALGRTAEAVAALRAEDMPASEVPGWLLDPALDPFRSDPHFVRLLATLGLTEAHARMQAWRAAQPPETRGRKAEDGGQK